MEKLASFQGILSFWLIAARIGGLFMSAPILDSSVLPRQVRVAFVLIFSFLLFPVVTLPEGFNFSGYPVDYILYFIKEIGLKIPDDISIVGYDDIKIASYTSPSLTTVRVSMLEMAAIAVKNLIKFIEKDIVYPCPIFTYATNGERKCKYIHIDIMSFPSGSR